MKSVTTIPGIRSVGVIRTALLPPQCVMKTLACISVYVPDDVQGVCVEGVAQAEIVDEYANNGREVTTTLKFSSAERIDLSVPQAFIYVDMLGESYLVGAKEKPYPVVTAKQGTGVPGSSSAVVEYEVKWHSVAPPAKCYLNFVD